MDDQRKKSLTQHELRTELKARKDRLEQHLAGLQSEMTIADLNVSGRPILDYVRERPLLAAGVAAGVGLLAGVASGLRARPEPEPPSDHDLWMSAYLDDLIEESSFRVRNGEDAATALRKALRKRAPVVVLEAEPTPQAQARGTVSMLLNTAVGFGVKLALDRVAQRLAGDDEIVHAMEDAAARGTPEEAGVEPVTYPPVEPVVS